MKDFDMSWEAEHEKAIARTQAQLEAGEYAEVRDKHAKAIARLEIIWRAAERALDGKPEGADAGAMFFDLKAFHRRADAFAARLADMPMPRDGSR